MNLGFWEDMEFVSSLLLDHLSIVESWEDVEDFADEDREEGEGRAVLVERLVEWWCCVDYTQRFGQTVYQSECGGTEDGTKTDKWFGEDESDWLVDVGCEKVGDRIFALCMVDIRCQLFLCTLLLDLFRLLLE